MTDPIAGPSWTEQERLSALRNYAILDTSPEQAFDDIVRLTGQLLNAPIVAVNLIDAGRQWFKSEIGLGVREMPLDDSICKFALLQGERMVVPDTRDDPRFNCNPLVTGGPGLRFYAGEVLKTDDGLPLGTLCILDTAPRPLGLSELEAFTLKTLARQVWSQLELRKIVHEQKQVLAEQERMQAELRRAQERTRVATEAAELGLWSWDSAADQVVWGNTRPCEILGISPADGAMSASRFLREVVHPDDSAAFAAAMAATLGNGAQFHFAGRLLRADGALCWADFFGKAQPSVEGAPPQVLGVVSDITARKLAEFELDETRGRFENIVSQAATGVVQADAEGRITLVNQKFCEMLGYQAAELMHTLVVDITAPGSLEASRAALEKVAAGDGGAVVHKQYRRKDGSLLWATSSVSGMRGGQGEYLGVVAIVVDISESRQAEQNLRKLAADLSEADRRKSEFLATLAHELRNPLAPISSGLSLLKLGGDSAAGVAKIREMMERQVGQMVRLIDDLLDVARISGGKIHLKKSRIALHQVMASAIETSRPFIEGGAHQLVVAYPAEPLFLDADATRIAQVFSNLLNNAAKYTPRGGRIGIAARRDGEAVLISVEDNGIGIAPESLSSIFEMFNQVGHNIDRAQGGLGVGLSLVRKLVEMHDGTVMAASAGEGTGSAFIVRMPVAAGTADAPSPCIPGPAATQRRFRLLVADDNVDAAATMAAMFELQGHTPRVANNGVAAIAIARDFQPEIAFLDIGMPDMDGFETARAMRNIEGLDKLVLVALTGWGDASDRVRSRAAGFDYHLTKPADMAAVDSLFTTLADNAGN